MNKSPRVVDAEITEDGYIVIEFNSASKVYPHTSKAVFSPEVLIWLVEKYGEIPPAEDTEYPGLPMVDESILSEMMEEDGDGEE